MRKAVYAGSFDPPTNGHFWMIEQGSRLFDDIVVAIGINPDKKYRFSLNQRSAMLREMAGRLPNVTVDCFVNQYLVNYASSIGAHYVLRGVRNGVDYEFERGMQNINRDLNPDIETVFQFPPRELVEVSSSFVKGLVGPEGWEEVVRQYLPEPVYEIFVKEMKK